MQLIVFVGTTEEFKAVSPALKVSPGALEVQPAVSEASEEDGKESENDGQKRFMTVDEAIIVLSRLKLSGSMRKILRALCAAFPKRLTSKELRDLDSLTADQ